MVVDNENAHNGAMLRQLGPLSRRGVKNVKNAPPVEFVNGD